MIYRVNGYGKWFVVNAANKREARSIGVSEFGAEGVVSVARSTVEEAREFIVEKGYNCDWFTHAQILNHEAIEA